MTQADAVLDDDVVEIRRHAQKDLPDDVEYREMLRVERGRPAGAGGRNSGRSSSPTTSFTASRRRHEVRFRQVAQACACPWPWAQMMEST